MHRFTSSRVEIATGMFGEQSGKPLPIQTLPTWTYDHPQQAGIRKLSSLTWKITPTSNCPLKHLIQAILLTSRIHKSQLTKHYNYLVWTLEDDKGSAQRWWADWPNAGLLKTENHSHDDRLVAWVWMWVWAWMWVWVWVWVCVCVRAHAHVRVRVSVRARVCVCVCMSLGRAGWMVNNYSVGGYGRW